MGESEMATEVRELMTPSVSTVGSRASIQEAAELMRDHDIGILPVIEDGRLVGVLTDRDVTVRSVARGLDPRRTLVREAMTAHAVTCHQEDTVHEALRRMNEAAVRRVLVIDANERLVGMLSLDDLARTPGAWEQIGQLIEHVAHPGDGL